MAALEMPLRPYPSPPSEGESRLARESGRRLDAQIADLITSADGNGSGLAARLVVQIPGRPASEPMAIPASALRLLGDILLEMARGNAIMLTPIHAELTTIQAADILNVSRPFVCKLLDNDEIPHRKVGRHRRVKFVDLMDYKRRTEEARNRSLEELTSQAQALDMGY